MPSASKEPGPALPFRAPPALPLLYLLNLLYFLCLPELDTTRHITPPLNSSASVASAQFPSPKGCPLWTLNWLLTRRFPKSFRIRRVERRGPRAENKAVTETAFIRFRGPQALKDTYKKPEGGLGAKASACALCSRPLVHPEPRRACPPRRATAALLTYPLLTTHSFLVSRLRRYSSREP